MKTKISITIDEELVKRLMTESEVEGRSVSNFVNRLLAEYFENREK